MNTTAAPVTSTSETPMREKPAPEPLLTAGQVGAFFGVDPRTITKWARAGKFPALRTLGGHRRFDPADVRRLLAAARTGENQP